MDFIIVVLSLCSVATARLQHTSSRSSITNQFSPVITNQFPPGITNQFPTGITNQFPPGITNQFPPGITNQFPPGITNQFPPGNTNQFPPGITNRFPIAPVWSATYVFDPIFRMPQPPSTEYDSPVDDQEAARDIGLFLNNKNYRHQNVLDLFPNPMQNDQMPYPHGLWPSYISPKPIHKPSELTGFWPDTGLPDVPIPGTSSPFEYYSSVARQEDTPKWTSFVKTIQKFDYILKTNMVNIESENHSPFEDSWLNDRALYTLLIGVVLELMDEVAKEEKQYDEIFDSSLQNLSSTVGNPSNTPHELAKSIWDRMMDIAESENMIRSFIQFMNQSVFCNNSTECDKVIDDRLKTTTHERLKDEARLLVADFKMAEVFLANYAAEFEKTASDLAVHAYLGDFDKNNLKTKLKPLILAGAELIKLRKEMSPTQPLDLTLFPNFLM